MPCLHAPSHRCTRALFPTPSTHGESVKKPPSGVRKVAEGARRVAEGARKVEEVARKVAEGARKVAAAEGARKVEEGSGRCPPWRKVPGRWLKVAEGAGSARKWARGSMPFRYRQGGGPRGLRGCQPDPDEVEKGLSALRIEIKIPWPGTHGGCAHLTPHQLPYAI